MGRNPATDFEKEAAFSGWGLHALIPGSGSTPPQKEGPERGRIREEIRLRPARATYPGWTTRIIIETWPSKC